MIGSWLYLLRLILLRIRQICVLFQCRIKKNDKKMFPRRFGRLKRKNGKNLTKEKNQELAGQEGNKKERDLLMDLAAQEIEAGLQQPESALGPDSIIESDGRPIVINAKAGAVTR